MKSFTLAIVVDSYWPQRGGAEQAMVSFAASLPEDWRVTIITHAASDARTLYGRYAAHRQMPSNDPAGKVIEPLQAPRRARLLLLPLLLWNVPLLRKLLPQVLYDILYFWYRMVFCPGMNRLLDDADSVHCCSTGYPARCVAEICLKRGITFIQQPFIHFGRWGDSPALLRSYAAADAVICPTARFRERLTGRLERLGVATVVDALVIPPVISEKEYPKLRLPPVPGRFILFLGRREAHKGLMKLLVAFTGLEGMASLVIAGPGEKIRTRNTSVFDLGEVDDSVKNWLLSTCDVFCVPTSDESFGIVFAEAMRYGKPVVACDVAPVNELVIHGETGILVPVDDTDGIHLALERLLDDSALRKRFGVVAQQRYEKYFARSVVLEQMIRLHRSR
jgi:glycosyltransferase involved in cell wall biosynthesis